MVTSSPAAAACERIGGDDVVGLVAFLLDAGTLKARAASRTSLNCGQELVGRLGPVGLVAVEQVAAEAALAGSRR